MTNPITPGIDAALWALIAMWATATGESKERAAADVNRFIAFLMVEPSIPMNAPLFASSDADADSLTRLTERGLDVAQQTLNRWSREATETLSSDVERGTVELLLAVSCRAALVAEMKRRRDVERVNLEVQS